MMNVLASLLGWFFTNVLKIDINQDGKTDLSELFAFFGQLSTRAIAVYGSWSESIKAFEDAEKRESFIADFAQEFDLDNDKLEKWIENLVFWVNDGSGLIESFPGFKQENKEA